MKFDMKMTGLADLQRNIRSLSNGVPRKVQIDALKAGAEPIRAEMAILAPRSDEAPHIADHIVIGIPRTNLDAHGIHEGDAVVAVGPEKSFFYGFFREFGTIHQAAHPFVRPAYDLHIAQAQQIVAAKLWDGVLKTLAKQHSAQSVSTASAHARSTGGGLL